MARQPKKGARITGQQRGSLGDLFKRKYQKGASVREIAQASGRSYGFVHRVLIQAGVHLRGRGGPNHTGSS